MYDGRMSDHEPGTYSKGERTKVASTRADAVALVFDGYKRVGDADTVEAVDTNQPVEVASDLGQGEGDVSDDADPGASGTAAAQF